MTGELLTKYIWLIQTLVRAGERGLSMAELSERWESRFGDPYPRRTFNNHREAIQAIFGIAIGCDRSTWRYFIHGSEDISDGDSETAWIINTFTVSNMLTQGKERLPGRISVEDIPSGHRYLTQIMEAMLGNRELRISYAKYTSEKADWYTVWPYALKEYSRRWYVVGYCRERSAVRVYGLDRIDGLEMLGNTFRLPAGFDVDELFATSFGIYLSDRPAARTTFRATLQEAKFLRDLPIHWSQKEEASDGNSVTFSIFAAPNTNMIMELCRHGDRIEVLEPAEIRKAVAEELRRALALYDSDKTE